MSAWLTVHGWKLGLVLMAVGVVLGHTNPFLDVLLSVATLLCFSWGLAVRVRRAFLEGYRGEQKG